MYFSKVSKERRNGYPKQAELIMIVGRDGIRNGSIQEQSIVGLEDFFGECWRRNDNPGYKAEPKFHYGAISAS